MTAYSGCPYLLCRMWEGSQLSMTVIYHQFVFVPVTALTSFLVRLYLPLIMISTHIKGRAREKAARR